MGAGNYPSALCTDCRRPLPALGEVASGEYVCPCGIRIPYVQGIYRFIECDAFYEGRFICPQDPSSKSAIHRLVLAAIRWGSVDGNEERMWRRSIRVVRARTSGRPLHVLNVGAGGGHAFLRGLGHVSSVDLSLQSLSQARAYSDVCYQADARCLPFEDGAFDLVFTSHVLGHIPIESKQEAIAEIARVTRSGGFSLNSIECEADNFVYGAARRYPDLYDRYFKDMYGHYGLELPSLCMARFRKAGFEPVFEFSDYCKGVVRPADSYKVFFGNEYREKGILFRVLASLSSAFSFCVPASVFAGFALYPFTLLNRLGGPDSVDSVKLLYVKL